MKKTYQLTPQQVSDAVADYVRRVWFPEADEIDCFVKFEANPGRANVSVCGARKSCIDATAPQSELPAR